MEQHLSLWKDTSSYKHYFPALMGDISVNVLIVGGGITGLTSALMLAQAGKTVAVVEAQAIGMGTTSYSTGNLYAPVSQHLFSIQEKWGPDVTKLVVQSRTSAIDFIEKTVKNYAIHCDFQRRDWHFYTSTEGRNAIHLIDKEFDALERAGLNPCYVEQLALPFKTEKAIRVEHQAQLHPVNYVRGLAKALVSDTCRIFENTAVVSIESDGAKVHTNRGTIHCDQLILATHTPKGFDVVQAEMMAAQEFGLAATLKTGSYPEGIFWGIGKSKHSIRSSLSPTGTQHLIVVGENFLTGHEDDTYHYLQNLIDFTEDHFDVNEITHTWLGQHYRPADTLPYIGKSPTASNNTYIATGFSTDGLVYGTLSGMIISAEILGVSNAWSDLYKATRFDPLKAGKQIWKQNVDAIKHYVSDYLTSYEVEQLSHIPCKGGSIVEIDGDKLAVYRNEHGQLKALSPVCTHMKCMVHWNNAEQTWDCPCHGSRFNTEGDVIEGPALRPLEKKEIQLIGPAPEIASDAIIAV